MFREYVLLKTDPPKCFLMTPVLSSVYLKVGGDPVVGHDFLLRSPFPAEMRPTSGTPPPPPTPPALLLALLLPLLTVLPQPASGGTPFPQDLEPISVVGQECE